MSSEQHPTPIPSPAGSAEALGVIPRQPSEGSGPSRLRFEAQLLAGRLDQEALINRVRTVTWSAIGLLLFSAGFIQGSADALAGIYLAYAAVCFLVWRPLIRRAAFLKLLPSFLVLADIGIIISSGFWAGPEALQEGVLQGIIGGTILILCTGALRLDWFPCAAGGAAGMLGLFALRAAYEPPSLYHLVSPATVGAITFVLCVGIRRTRSFAEHLFDEVHNTQEQRTMVMGQLVAGVAHEMNSPLGALRSSLATVQRAFEKLDEVPERTARAVSSSVDNAQTALGRIDEFLERLRPFAYLDAAPREALSLKSLLQAVVELETGVQTSGARLSIELEDDQPVLGNSAQLGVVFLNLLRNAFEAAGPAGHVNISSAVAPEYIRVSISDDGPGMSDAAMVQAFAPSFSDQGGRVKLGLGLAVARGLVQQHNGHLELSRGPEGGTLVVVDLPRFSPEFRSPTPPPKRAPKELMPPSSSSPSPG